MTRKTRWVVGLCAAGVLMCVWLATAVFLGAPIGEPCDKEWGCKGMDAVCLQGDAPMCSRHCEADTECPAGWACGAVQVLKVDGKNPQPDIGSSRVCLPGGAP